MILQDFDRDCLANTVSDALMNPGDRAAPGVFIEPAVNIELWALGSS